MTESTQSPEGGLGSSAQGQGESPLFVTTLWSVVLTAGDAGSARSLAALEQLCGTYWYPLYAFARRSGQSPEDARDLTQEFFARLITKNYLSLVDPGKGRFRSFLLTAFKRFLYDQWDREQAQKRGGGQVPISLDEVGAETRYSVEAVDGVTPETLFDRRWALAALERVFQQLEREFDLTGRTAEFQVLKPFLTMATKEIPSAAAAGLLSISGGALRVAVHRLRQRFRQLFREEIMRTVQDPEEVEPEIRHLMKVLAG